MLLIIIYINSLNVTYNFSNVFSLVLVALVINITYFVSFNPIQSSKPIFEVGQLPGVQNLSKIQVNDQRNWLVREGYPGAILYGAGLNSFTNVLMQPQLKFFKGMYPLMDENEFNNIFNRYAHIQLYNGTEPFVPQPDVIQIPIKDLLPKVSINDVDNEIKGGNVNTKGSIDYLNFSNDTIEVLGWGMIGPHNQILSNLPSEYFIGFKNTIRTDVSVAYKDLNLTASGFSLQFKKSKEDR